MAFYKLYVIIHRFTGYFRLRIKIKFIAFPELKREQERKTKDMINKFGLLKLSCLLNSQLNSYYLK